MYNYVRYDFARDNNVSHDYIVHNNVGHAYVVHNYLSVNDVGDECLGRH